MDTNVAENIMAEWNENAAPYYEDLIRLLMDNAMDSDDADALANAIVDLIDSYS